MRLAITKQLRAAQGLTWGALALMFLLVLGLYVGLTRYASFNADSARMPAGVTTAQSPEAQPDDTQEPTTGLANPVLEHFNLEEMVATTGIAMTIPDGAEALAFRSINKELNEVEVRYRGATYLLRKARSAEADISGVYEAWGTVEKMRAPNAEIGEVMVSRSSDRGIVTWNDGTYAHSIFADAGFDIANALNLVTP